MTTLPEIVAHAEWEESKHPRAGDGKFGSGGGKGKPAAKGGGKEDHPEASTAAGFAAWESKPRKEAAAKLEAAAAKIPALAAAVEATGPFHEYVAASKTLADAKAAFEAAKAALADEDRQDFQAYMVKNFPTGNRVPSMVYGGKWTQQEYDRMGQADLFFSCALSPSLGDIPEVKYDRAKEGRAYYQAGGYVHLTRGDKAGVYVHEIGHHLENTIPGAKAKVHAFLKKRCGGEEAISLKEKFPSHGYAADEEGRADDFGKLFRDESSAYYVGKIYPPTYSFSDPESADTEVLSMGLELLHDNPRHFAKTDPEFFNLVVSIINPEAAK